MPSRLSAADFDYPFDPSLIAQRPLADRGASRMLVLHRGTGSVEHRQFRDFPDLLNPGDALVVNATRVIPARLKGARDNGGEAEILLVYAEPDGSWLAMAHPGGKLKAGPRKSSRCSPVACGASGFPVGSASNR